MSTTIVNQIQINIKKFFNIKIFIYLRKLYVKIASNTILNNFLTWSAIKS